MATGTYLFTSESVSMGHPDKLADQISDAILDALIKGDPFSRVACETMVTTGRAIISGEISSQAKVDYVDGLMGAGFKIESLRKMPVHLSGPMAEAVHKVIETQINPGVASHGGVVTLVDIKDKTVVVQLGGGCQGCGQADVTLKEGIVRSIKEAVPEVEEVVDATDHGSGENPYY